MLIKTKYIDCASKSVFNTWKLPTSAADTSGDIYWSAIVYIQDTGEVWTHGKLYGGFFSNADSNKVSLTIGGTTKILALDGHVQSYTTLTGSGTTADQAILSTGVANKWTLKTLGKNAFSNVDYLPADATAVAAEKVVNAMRFQYNGKDMHSFDGSVARLLNIIQGDNVFITGDSQGNVTIAADPGSDTVNTAGATNLINKKLFLIGAESQTTSPQTYSNQYVYIGTDNCLYSLGKKVLTEHQAIYNLDLQTQVGDTVTKVTTFDPNAANNSFTLVQGTNVTLTPDATNKRVTISSKDTTYDFYNLIFKQGDAVIDIYKPTTSPNKAFRAGTNVTFTKSGDEVIVTTQDTRNTAGATEKAVTKLYLTGAITQTANPLTYSNSKVYIGADNKLYSDGKVVSTGDHTHNYAGATSPGGPALKVDLNPSGLLAATYGSYGGILQDSNNGPAAGSWSNRIKILHNNTSGYYTELAQAFTGTAGLWHRRNVAGVVSDWTPVIDKANFRTYLDATYVIRGNDPNVLTNYVRYNQANGLTMNWEWGNATPTHIWGTKGGDSSKAYVFNGDNIRAFANAVNRAGDTMTGTLKVTEIQATNGNGLVMWNGTTYTYLGMQAGTTYIRSGETDLQHRYNGTDYKIWDARNLVGLRTEHSHNTINHIDSRDVASTPQEHRAGVWLDFKANAKANLTDGGSYTGLLTVRKYGDVTDWTGGKSAQLGFTDNSNLWVRFGTGTAWEAWKQIATTSWANSKFLPLAGGTMTGTLRIKCATTNYQEGLTIQNADGQWCTIRLGNTADVGTTANTWSIHRTSNNNFAISRNSSDGANGISINQSGNVGIGYANTAIPAYRLAVSGAGYFGAGLTSSGNINQNADIIMGQAGSTGVRQIRMQCGDNDFGRIAVGATASNAGWLEIATADDANEPIYVRQYSGVFTTLSRTLTLLDASGNTTMPGTASAGNFSTAGRYITSYSSGTWINSVTNAALTVNMGGYGGVWCAPVKGGRVAMSVYPASDNNVYLGYASAAQITAGTNSFTKRTYWNADDGIWRAGGYAKDGSDASHVLLGDGGHTSLGSLGTSHNHFERTSIDPNNVISGPRTYESTSAANRPDTNAWHQYTTLGTGDNSYCHQLSYAYAGGTNIYHRIRNAGSWGSWITILDSSNYGGICDGRYVNVSGDTMTGKLTIQSTALNGTYNGLLVGDDCNIGDCNMGNTIGLMGVTNNNAGMIKFGKGGYQFGYNGSNHTVSGTGLWTNLNADMLDGSHASDFVRVYTGRFNQYNRGTWTKILQFTINSGSLYPTITFTWHPTECARDIWADFSINIRSGGIIFYALWKGGATRTMYCVGDGTTYSVWVSGTKTSYDPYGLIQVVSHYGVNTYSAGNLQFSDSEPSGTYKVAPTIAGRINYATSAGNADTVDGQHASAFSYESWWHWSGQGGQPTWLWGGNSKNSYYVYNPSNFNVNSATYAHKVRGEYTSNGGQQNPNYFGRNWVGFRMMNTTVGSNSQYKDWIISDCYPGNDVGGAVAFGMNRQSLGAYLMGSDAARTSWTRKGTFWGDWNLDPVSKLDSIVPGTILHIYTSSSITDMFVGTTSGSRGKTSAVYTVNGTSYTRNLSKFTLLRFTEDTAIGINSSAYGNYNYTLGSNSHTISNYEMPAHRHYLGTLVAKWGDDADNRNFPDFNGTQVPDGDYGNDPNRFMTRYAGAGIGETAYSWNASSLGKTKSTNSAMDMRQRTYYTITMVYNP